MIIFGSLFAYSVFIIFMGGSPGGLIVVGVLGLIVSIGDYVANQK